MKVCQVCNKSKNESEFYKHKGRKDGLRANCIECGREMAREFYKKNPNPYKKRAYKFKKIKKNRRKEWINEIRNKYGCQLCGLHELEILDFHHFNSKEKLFCITNYSSDIAINKLINEINKCVVLCANCHRRVHAKTKNLTKDMICKVEIPKRLDNKESHVIYNNPLSPT